CQDLLTFVLVGGGPTGVEMAAALAVFLRSVRKEYRRIDLTSARIILVDAGLYPLALLGAVKPQDKRADTMAMDVFHRPARFSAAHSAPRYAGSTCWRGRIG